MFNTQLRRRWFFPFAGVILLSLPYTRSQRGTKSPQDLQDIMASPGHSVTLSCGIPAENPSRGTPVTWYKERQNKSLCLIYTSTAFSQSEGKYSSYSNSPASVSLIIRNVQRNDSGVYYCGTPVYEKFDIHKGMRLIVTDGSRTRLSILVPPSLEETELNHSIPLLCLLFNAHPFWHTISWNISREKSQKQDDVGMIDRSAEFNIWSLELLPLKTWIQGRTYSCSVQENRSISAVFQKGTKPPRTENCLPTLYLGIICIATSLLIAPFVLVFRKHRARGNKQQPGSHSLTRNAPQTEYAEVRFSNPNQATAVD